MCRQNQGGHSSPDSPLHIRPLHMTFVMGRNSRAGSRQLSMQVWELKTTGGPKYTRSSYNSILEKQTTQSKSGKKTETYISPKKTYRWLTNTWKDAQHRSLLEKCKSKPQWSTISCQSEWPLSKSLQAINVGEGVEKKECSCTVGNINWYSHYGRWYGDSLRN